MAAGSCPYDSVLPLEVRELRRRVADPGDDVLALRIHEVVPVDLLLPRRGIAREGDAGAGVRAAVPEHHRLHVHRRPQAVGMLDLRGNPPPACRSRNRRRAPTESRAALRGRGSRAGRALMCALNATTAPFQRLRVNCHVLPVPTLRSPSPRRPRARTLAAESSTIVAEHQHEATVGIVREALVAGLLSQAFDGVSFSPRFRPCPSCRASRTSRPNARRPAADRRIAEPLPRRALRASVLPRDLVHHPRRREVHPLEVRRHATVLTVKPGGTGRPMFVISARFAPLPPRRPSALLALVEEVDVLGHPMPPELVGNRALSLRRRGGRSGREHRERARWRPVWAGRMERVDDQHVLADQRLVRRQPLGGREVPLRHRAAFRRAPPRSRRHTRPRRGLPAGHANGMPVGSGRVPRGSLLLENRTRSRASPITAGWPPAVADDLQAVGPLPRAADRGHRS